MPWSYPSPLTLPHPKIFRSERFPQVTLVRAGGSGPLDPSPSPTRKEWLESSNVVHSVICLSCYTFRCAFCNGYVDCKMWTDFHCQSQLWQRPGSMQCNGKGFKWQNGHECATNTLSQHVLYRTGQTVQLREGLLVGYYDEVSVIILCRRLLFATNPHWPISPKNIYKIKLPPLCFHLYMCVCLFVDTISENFLDQFWWNFAQ